jgi:MFS transporter, SP family, sugar:H+ symporter
MGEMFPLYARSYSASFATAGNWSWNFLLTFFTPFITSSIGFRYGYVFAGCNLIGVLVVFFFYYESSGLNLEQVDIMYSDPSVQPWHSTDWVPVGYKSRYHAAEATKEDQIRGAGIRTETENLENVNRSSRGSADTRVGQMDKEKVENPIQNE